MMEGRCQTPDGAGRTAQAFFTLSDCFCFQPSDFDRAALHRKQSHVSTAEVGGLSMITAASGF